jgi:hypothetical protein
MYFESAEDCSAVGVREGGVQRSTCPSGEQRLKLFAHRQHKPRKVVGLVEIEKHPAGTGDLRAARVHYHHEQSRHTREREG